MIEKKTLWAVTHELEVKEKTAIVEDGNLMAAKDPDEKDASYDGHEYGVIRYFDTEEEAKKWVADEEKAIRDAVPRVRKFIAKMDYEYGFRERLGIEKKDYLGDYADANKDNSRDWYNTECEYANKLEIFIKSRMLSINCHLTPVDQVRGVQWYGIEGADECEAGNWKAVLTTTDGEEIETGSEEDVRLVWAVLGKCVGLWYVDNDIDYDKDDDE